MTDSRSVAPPTFQQHLKNKTKKTIHQQLYRSHMREQMKHIFAVFQILVAKCSHLVTVWIPVIVYDVDNQSNTSGVNWICSYFSFLSLFLRVLEASIAENKASLKRTHTEVWSDSPNPHDRKRIEHCPVGLKNVGNTCWFSAVIQVGTNTQSQDLLTKNPADPYSEQLFYRLSCLCCKSIW